jgi:hypothetical protein
MANSEQSNNNNKNFQLELEQVSLWNRHAETILWTVGSVLLSSSYYAISKIIDNSIKDKTIVIIMSIGFISILLVFIFNYLPTVLKDTFRLSKRMKKLDKELGIKLHYSLTGDYSLIGDNNSNDDNQKISLLKIYKSPLGMLFTLMTISNITGWGFLLCKNIFC